MLVEIHLLQNHAPANLNRDDTGSPKDCLFGGVRRSRISSQCLKRSIRRSPHFTEGLEGTAMGIRTRRLPERIKQYLLDKGAPEDLAAVAAQKVSGFGTKEGKEQDTDQTAQTMFLAPSDFEAIGNLMLKICEENQTAKQLQKVSAKDLQKHAALRGWRPITPDIAVFGRMVTSDAFRNVEASIQVAHAISTHKMDHEFDYFTAVDDLQEGSDSDETGADMIGDVEFNSACYYKYFSLDIDALVDNLVGPSQKSNEAEHAEAKEEAKQIAVNIAKAFLKAAVFTTPSGKQNSFAANQLPDGVLIELRPHKLPVSYANAFVKPAFPTGRMDLVAGSLDQFIKHVENITKLYSLPAAGRLWFTTRDCEIEGTSKCGVFSEVLDNLGRILESGCYDG